MRRFQFRLAQVLRLKEQRKRVAELRQKQARMAVELARAHAASMQAQLARAAAALTAHVGREVRPGAWMTQYEHSARLGRALESAEAEVERALQNEREASAQRIQIATEVEALLYLRRQQWREHWQEAMRLEQIRLDDLGMRRWQAAQAAEAAAEPSLRETTPP